MRMGVVRVSRLAMLGLVALGLVVVPGAGPVAGTPLTFTNADDFVIFDQTALASSVVVPGGACQSGVNDVNVAASWTHTRNAELRFELRSPAGTLTTLMANEGGATDDGNVLFDDEAELLAENVDTNAPTGWLRPEAALDALDGFEASGTWDLIVTDEAMADTGVLTEWSLRINCFDPISDFPTLALPIPPVPIPDLGAGTLSVQVADCATVTDVDAEFVLQHSQVSDLVIELEHGGTTVLLWDSSTSSERGAWLRFDDEAATPAQAVAVDPEFQDPWPVGIAFVTPDTPLAAFDGAPGDGAWTLTVRDISQVDSGQLQQFGLGVTCEAPPPPGADPVIALFGAGRVQTAVAVSQELFPDPQTASVAVLATEGNFADALAGTPLAVVANGPLLLTPVGQLVGDTEAELSRLLPPGSTVYLLGGEVALSSAVESAVASLGFTPERLAGPSRYETAAAIADEVASLEPLQGVVIADGNAFQAALVGGAAAARLDAALLLSNGPMRHPATDAFLQQGLTGFGVGSVAVGAYPETVVLSNQAEPAAMSVEVAAQLDALVQALPSTVGVANLVTFPDGLTGGAHVAAQGGPLLLTAQQTLSPEVDGYLRGIAASVGLAFVYGGDAAIAPAVRDAIGAAISA